MKIQVSKEKFKTKIIALMAAKNIILSEDEIASFFPSDVISRFDLHDDHRGKKSGWCVINKNIIHCGSWKGEKHIIKLDKNGGTFKFNKEKYLADKRDAENRRKQLQSQAASDAWALWQSAEVCQSHEYLKNKKVKSFGLREYQGNILIPITNNQGQLSSLHFINLNGGKWFFKNGEIKGNYFCIGDFSKASKIIVSEGYSTAASLYEVTLLPQVIAFNAGNLLLAARNIHTRYPNMEIVIAADNDSKSKINIGLVKAKEAARAAAGKVICPQFLPDDDGTDFNDFAMHYGHSQLLTLLKNQDIV